MVALSTMGFSQYSLVNDTIFTDVPVAVVNPEKGEIITFYEVSETVMKKMSVLASATYPDVNKFQFFYVENETRSDDTQSNEYVAVDKTRPLRGAGKRIRDGATILLVSPVAGGLLMYGVNPVLGGLVTIGGFISGYVQLIRAGEELENYKEG